METHEKKEMNDYQLNKYCEIFNRFNSLPQEDELTAIVISLLDRGLKDIFSKDVLKIIYGCIDVTTLSALDTKETVRNMVDKEVNNFEVRHPDMPRVAAICVYPVFVDTVQVMYSST